MDSSGNHFAQISLDRSPSYLVFFHSLRERERERDFKSLVTLKKKRQGFMRNTFGKYFRWNGKR